MGGTIQAQNLYQEVLNQIEANSVTLKAYQKHAEAQQVANYSGSFLDNPEIGANYLFGSPKEKGNRIDFNVSQSFDFPTVYCNKSKIRKMNDEVIDIQYQIDRIAILSEAQDICTEIIYYNILIEIYGKCYANAKSIAEGIAKRFEFGVANIFDYNKSQMSVANAKNDYDMAMVEKRNLLAKLKTLNGGIDIEFDVSSFPAAVLPDDFEKWYIQIEEQNPEIRQISSQLAIDEQSVRLSKSEWLPRFSLGYMLEREEDSHYQGITFGMSLPLWQNRKTVRAAKANADATEALLSEAKTVIYNNLYGIYLKARALQENIETLNARYEQHDSQDLLKKAYDKGEISLIEYLLEVDFYQESRIKILDAEMELQEAVIELNKWRM